MGKAMKAAKAPTQSATLDALADASGIGKKEVKTVIEAIGSIAVKTLKGSGKFVVPGVAMLKLKKKPATKAGTRQMFGQTMKVKAKPAKTVVKAFPVSALKKQKW